MSHTMPRDKFVDGKLPSYEHVQLKIARQQKLRIKRMLEKKVNGDTDGQG